MSKVVKKPTTILYPLPVVLVSCGVDAQANIITLAWAGTLCSQPPTIGIGVRPSRHSHGLIKELGEFVVNLPSVDQTEWVDYCGNVSGRDVNKWQACGFSPTPSSEVQVPLIAECAVNIECRVRQTVSLGAHDLFLGEVVGIQVDEDVLDASGGIDIAKAQPLSYVNGEYRQIGDVVGRFGYSRK